MELTDAEAIDIAFIENIHREDLTPIEEAKVFLARLKTNPDFLKNFKKCDTVSHFFSENTIGDNHSLIKGNEKKDIKGLSEIYKIQPKTIARKLSLLVLPEAIQTGIEHGELLLTFGYEIARLREINDYNIAQNYMEQIYEDCKKEKDSLSLEELKGRINKKIEFEKDKETAQVKLDEQRKEEIETEIDKIKKARISEINKLIQLSDDVFNEAGLEPDENYQITESEDEEILEKAENLQEFLDAENLKYQDDTLYEDVVNKITKLESDITDMKLLIKRARQHDLPRCPYCRAGIDIKYIVKDIKNFTDELEGLRGERGSISGKKSFIYDKLTKLQRLINSITTKDEAIETLESELETLG